MYFMLYKYKMRHLSLQSVYVIQVYVIQVQNEAFEFTKCTERSDLVCCDCKNTEDHTFHVGMHIYYYHGCYSMLEMYEEYVQ